MPLMFVFMNGLPMNVLELVRAVVDEDIIAYSDMIVADSEKK